MMNRGFTVYHENYWPHFQLWLSCVTICTLLYRLSCNWYTFSDRGKQPEIPEMTTSSWGADCRDCRLALVMTGMADSTDMLYCKQKYGCIMQTQLKLEYVICSHRRFQSFKFLGRPTLILAVIYGWQGRLLRRLMPTKTKYCIIHSINISIHSKTVYCRCVPNWTCIFSMYFNWFMTLLTPCSVVELLTIWRNVLCTSIFTAKE
jgi:hypothetical protein